jgi:hypothetical protein
MGDRVMLRGKKRIKNREFIFTTEQILQGFLGSSL